MTPSSPSNVTAGQATEQPVSASRLGILALSHRRMIVGMPIVAVLLLAALILIPARRFTARVSFTPVSSASSAAALAGVAAQFGLSLPGDQATASPAFYADLLRTEAFFRRLAQARYRFEAEADTIDATFLDIYEFEEETRSKTLFEAVKYLREQVVQVSPNRQTGVVTLSVTTRWPALSVLMVRNLLEQVDAFNLAGRTFQAGAEQKFLGARRDSSQIELRGAEAALQAFLERNREFKSDPSLLFEYDRLQRQIAVRQQVFLTLTEGFERARLEAVRNTPSISVVEPPSSPLRPDRRYFIIKSFVVAVLSVLVAVLVATGIEYVLAARQGDPAEDLARLREEWLATKTDGAELARRVWPWGRRRAKS